MATPTAVVRKKVDSRVRTLIENGIITRHRTLIVMIGEKGRDQIVNLHYILTKSRVKTRPTVLWCYKNELGFSSSAKKRMKKMKKKMKKGVYDSTSESPFELFLSSTTIRYCYYHETHNILGNTFGMCILQDFEALTPNLLCRTIETVEGGGIIVLLLQTMSSLKQLYSLTMDVHKRFRTNAEQTMQPRFNERFILSLGSCERALVVDDELNILPISSHIRQITAIPRSEDEGREESKQLREVKDSLKDTQPIGSLVELAKTEDQARACMVSFPHNF
jgi:N-acetyltransferase 10